MAKKLLSKKLQQSIHIVLFFFVALFGFTATAQTVLLPGDMVIVSANADTQSIDFIPLIDIEKGTTVYFSNGSWDDSTQVLTGEELRLNFNADIPAGTNLHVNRIDDPRFNTSGELSFEGGTFRLFAYQKEESLHRFVYALGWGKGNVWNKEGVVNTGSDVPLSLKGNEYSYLTLGDASNHQYYIRYGASGTRKLLLKFVSDPSHWRSNDDTPFPVFGTSFNLLSPPVVLFDRSVSSVEESDSIATLNVAVYEHNGSRLSVDVVFDSLRSITNTSDFNGFTSKKINLTGLIGDGMYEVKVPLNDDSIYEGRETGIFTLENLSSGNFGDFLSHSLIVLDNEKPDVLISEIAQSTGAGNYIEIKNMEDGVISLTGWSLESGSQRFVFDDKAVLYPLESIRFKDSSIPSDSDSSLNVILSTLEDPLLRRNGGVLSLKDYEGNEISRFEYSRLRRSGEVSSRTDEMMAEAKLQNEAAQQDFEQGSVTNQISVLEQISAPGFKVLVNPDGFEDVFPDMELLSWSEEDQNFIKTDESSTIETKTDIVFGYIESDEIEKFTEWQQSQSAKKIITESSTLTFTVSGTDENGNEVLDGLEGLNLVYNNLNQSFTVSRFLEVMSSEFPDLLLNSKVYGIHQSDKGEINFKAFETVDEIAAGAPFFISLESHQEATEITLDQDQLQQPVNETIEETDPEENSGLFEVTLTSAEQAESVRIKFIEEGIIESTKDLNSYSELFLDQAQFLNVAFNQGDDYFSELTLSSNMEQALALPLSFSAKADGKFTLSITGWDEIPSEWQIILEDVKAEKEYTLRKDFSLSFDHVVPKVTTGSESDSDTKADENSLEDYKVADKFIIHVRPKGSEAENIEDTDNLPREVELHQNFPNPFNPATTISFYLPESEEVRLSVFNIVGQPVAVIAEGTMSAGEHQFEWDATDRPSGMYIYQLEVGKNVMTRKMTLVK